MIRLDSKKIQEIYEQFTTLYNNIAGIKYTSDTNLVYTKENTSVFPGKYKNYTVAITPTDQENRYIFSFKIAMNLPYSQIYDAFENNYQNSSGLIKYNNHDINMAEKEYLRDVSVNLMNTMFNHYKRDNIFVTYSEPNYLVWQVDAKLIDSSPRTISNAMLEEFRIAFPYLTGGCEIEEDDIDGYFSATIRTVSVGHWERHSADLRQKLNWITELDQTNQEALNMVIRKSSSLSPVLQCTILELIFSIYSIMRNNTLDQNIMNKYITEYINRSITVTEFYIHNYLTDF